MSESGGYQKMPPGWDCKYDQATGNCYYINYLTKAMQLEDPRGRSYRQLQNERCSTESIALQQLVSQPQTSHNSSPYHVHPSNNLTAIRAFQERQQPTLHNVSTSPLLSASSRGHLEMSSPLPFQRVRVGPNLSRRSTIQETSFTTQAETDAVVTKIQNMFPTAGENHIRLLLKRYMKNIFPKADEELLLDILANADNNVQFASEKLISLGYIKRDMQQPHRPNNRPPDLNQDQEAGGDQGGVHIPLRPKEYSEEEKTKMQTLLKEKYPLIAERIILMALESVNYAEDRASQILQIVQDEDEQRAQKQAPTNPKHPDLKKTTRTDQVDGANQKDRHRQHSFGNSHNSESAEFQSIIERMASLGPNSQLSKGADENLLLADYVTWNGPNTKLLQKQVTQGPDASLLTDRTYKPRGGNSELCKGPQSGLAKGSIYAQGSNKSPNIKCN
ncbi:uncharacterized protein LOC6539394 isoform X4 [Drosophila yakuba]|uniref:Uncharacterized protein, isoform B n=1 Tax=Drosophila yakuba TaxID=7245 RepID=A0A0R1E7N1_DROYA|nr:uncharacterized protein LOC6539394 isoform X4 [Drosophila yakuba]KRK05195.1 uncharacterized protein Dyak_GE23056, isoform B [Drosophila yakuba]